MKSLSASQAAKCENACTPRCKCRCGGALHGKGRLPATAPREAYEALPLDDPHRLQTRAEKKQNARLRKLDRDAGVPFGGLFA